MIICVLNVCGRCSLSISKECKCICHTDNPEWFKNGCWACRCWTARNGGYPELYINEEK